MINGIRSWWSDLLSRGMCHRDANRLSTYLKARGAVHLEELLQRNLGDGVNPRTKECLQSDLVEEIGHDAMNFLTYSMMECRFIPKISTLSDPVIDSLLPLLAESKRMLGSGIQAGAQTLAVHRSR